MLTIGEPLVSVQWLNDHLHEPNLIILNATLQKVTDKAEDIEQFQIPNARFFDIKGKFSKAEAPFPNTVPPTEQFIKEARVLGINNNSAIVVYDDYGIYSCARAWYLFKAFGFDNVAVLDGGLPEWKHQGLSVEKKSTSVSYNEGDFTGAYNEDYFNFFDSMHAVSEDKEYQIIDARSNERFLGLMEEPRPGLKAGHIPNSVNLPYGSLMNGNVLRSKEELQMLFSDLPVENKQMVFSCGSGITACILALAAEVSGYRNMSVYDGSWTEYGTLT